MKKVIKNDDNIKYLEELDSILTGMLTVWYRIMTVMKYVERQSQETIQQFKFDLGELKSCIHKLANKDVPIIPGLNFNVPNFLKSRVLFDHLLDFLSTWETLGGLNKQNIESTHPEFNELLRRYGCTRDAQMKIQVFCEYLFNQASFVNDVIKDLIKDTSKLKRPDSKVRAPAKELEQIGVIDLTDDDDLSEMEVTMNNNKLLRYQPEEISSHVKTKLVVCECGARLIEFGYDIHRQEYIIL